MHQHSSLRACFLILNSHPCTSLKNFTNKQVSPLVVAADENVSRNSLKLRQLLVYRRAECETCAFTDLRARRPTQACRARTVQYSQYSYHNICPDVCLSVSRLVRPSGTLGGHAPIWACPEGVPKGPLRLQTSRGCWRDGEEGGGTLSNKYPPPHFFPLNYS